MKREHRTQLSSELVGRSDQNMTMTPGRATKVPPVVPKPEEDRDHEPDEAELLEDATLGVAEAEAAPDEPPDPPDDPEERPDAAVGKWAWAPRPPVDRAHVTSVGDVGGVGALEPTWTVRVTCVVQRQFWADPVRVVFRGNQGQKTVDLRIARGETATATARLSEIFDPARPGDGIEVEVSPDGYEVDITRTP